MRKDLSELKISSKTLNKITNVFTLPKQILSLIITIAITPAIYLAFRYIANNIIDIFLYDLYDNYFYHYYLSYDAMLLISTSYRILFTISSPLIANFCARKAVYRNLKLYNKLNEQVKKFNSIVKAIDVNDQLLDAGHKGFSSQERKQAIDFLVKVKAKLVMALKTERIFRENKDIVNINNDFVINRLDELYSIQMDEKASEFGKLLSEAIKVIEEVEEEMINIKELSST